MNPSSMTPDQVVDYFYNLIPDHYKVYVLGVIVLCKILVIFVRPPPVGSALVPFYKLINGLALNFKNAANRLQVGKTGIMVDREAAPVIKQVAEDLGVKR